MVKGKKKHSDAAWDGPDIGLAGDDLEQLYV